MEEPLLGSKKRPFALFNSALFQIPEEDQANDPANLTHIMSPNPSSIKEMLIFGSPDTSAGSPFCWINCADQSSKEAESRLGADSSCTCANSTSTTGESMKGPEMRTFDDSFMVTGPGSSRVTFLGDLTRRDLAPSPRYRPSPLRSMILAEGRESGKTAPEEDEDKQSLKIPVSSEEPAITTNAACGECTKKQFHRSYTAPAVTVMEDKAQPHAAHESKPAPLSPVSFSVVTQAFMGLLLYLAVGVAIYTLKDNDFSGTSTHNVVDAIYFCIVTLCTIGYGDITPTTPFAKLFACAFVLVGFGFIDILLSGMVNYVLDSQEALLLNSVAAGHHEKAKTYLVDLKKGRMRIRMKVALAFGVVIGCIGLGTFVMHFLETLGWIDSFYLACMSVTTVGYGDHAFKTLAGRLFASIWLLVSTLAVARSFLYLAEARIDRRHRLIAKLMLQKEMTVGDLVAADLDHDGHVSKSDFVVYKLKQMGKIVDKDIAEVCRQFNRLDSQNAGKITLSCLIDLHETSMRSK